MCRRRAAGAEAPAIARHIVHDRHPAAHVAHAYGLPATAEGRLALHALQAEPRAVGPLEGRTLYELVARSAVVLALLFHQILVALLAKGPAELEVRLLGQDVQAAARAYGGLFVLPPAAFSIAGGAEHAA